MERVGVTTEKTGEAARGKPGAVLGILGGGQLARMLAQAAIQLGCEVVVLERNRLSPAAAFAARVVIGDWDDSASLRELGSLVDVVTLENEFVDADSLAALEGAGHKLIPGSACIRVVQDKLWQKQALRDAGLPVPRFADAPHRDVVAAAGKELGWPLLLKKRRNGYDGKGNATVGSAQELDEAWDRLQGDANALYVEEFCPFSKELAVIITRGQGGEVATYPVVETIQRNHICHIVKAPAPVSSDIADQAAEMARRAVESVNAVGSVGVELFLTTDGQISINEMAPRVHNSGHYSIEACECSQFENHVRAVFGWPLGSTRMRGAAAAMINLLGAGEGSGEPSGLEQALEVKGAHAHVYGKARSARGRKMGHVTALEASVEEAMRTASNAANLIRFGGNE